MQVTIVKHGKTDFNLEGRRQGKATDLSLNADGRHEVEELKQNFIQNYDLVIVSPLKRTVETANILFPNSKIELNDLLTEYDFGELEGIKFSEPLESFPDNKVVEYNGIKFLMPISGDTFESFVDKCSQFIEYIKTLTKKYNSVAVVTHSTNLEILRALIERKDWFTYLGQAKQFHGCINLEID